MSSTDSSDNYSFTVDYYWDDLSALKGEQKFIFGLFESPCAKRVEQLCRFLQRHPAIFDVRVGSNWIDCTVRVTQPWSSSNRRINASAFDVEYLNSITNVITTVEGCERFVREQIDCRSVVGFDCEWVTVDDVPRMQLMQFATIDKRIYLFDVATHPELVTSGGLKSLLESDDVIKVVHDCANDNANLLNEFSIKIRNVFDTQAACTVLLSHETGAAAVRTILIGLNNLCELRGVPLNDFKSEFKETHNIWADRPLTEKMKAYAAGDALSVIHLYQSLAPDLYCLPVEERQLFDDLCQDQVYRVLDPEAVKRVKKLRMADADAGVRSSHMCHSDDNRSCRCAEYSSSTAPGMDRIENIS